MTRGHPSGQQDVVTHPGNGPDDGRSPIGTNEGNHQPGCTQSMRGHPSGQQENTSYKNYYYNLLIDEQIRDWFLFLEKWWKYTMGKKSDGMITKSKMGNRILALTTTSLKSWSSDKPFSPPAGGTGYWCFQTLVRCGHCIEKRGTLHRLFFYSQGQNDHTGLISEIRNQSWVVARSKTKTSVSEIYQLVGLVIDAFRN